MLYRFKDKEALLRLRLRIEGRREGEEGRVRAGRGLTLY
jgi:hypothetical protein